MKYPLPASVDDRPHVVDRDQARYESYCDNLLMGVSRETLVGWFGELHVEQFEQRYRQENR